MKEKLLIAILLVSILLTSAILAGFSFSGDSGLDSALSELNLTAKTNIGDYKVEVCLGYNITESKFDYFYGVIKMEPADIFMALEFSTIAKVPIDKVVTIYQANKAKGWGYIAKELGIKPGSAEFKALKNKAQGHSSNVKNKPKEKGKK